MRPPGTLVFRLVLALRALAQARRWYAVHSAWGWWCCDWDPRTAWCCSTCTIWWCKHVVRCSRCRRRRVASYRREYLEQERAR